MPEIVLHMSTATKYCCLELEKTMIVHDMR